MLSPVATNGVAILLADGDIGVSVIPDGGYLVALLGSLTAMSDWGPYDGPMPDVPEAALAEVAAMKAKPQP